MNNQERIIVTYKPDNSKVSIMRKQFDGQVHEYLPEGGEVKAPKIAKKEDAPKQATEVIAEGEDRLAELKAIGWAKMNGAQRKEYKKLK